MPGLKLRPGQKPIVTLQLSAARTALRVGPWPRSAAGRLQQFLGSAPSASGCSSHRSANRPGIVGDCSSSQRWLHREPRSQAGQERRQSLPWASHCSRRSACVTTPLIRHGAVLRTNAASIWRPRQSERGDEHIHENENEVPLHRGLQYRRAAILDLDRSGGPELR